MNKLIIPALLAIALAGCGGDKADKQQGGKAEGQILPASVSDAMIPVDQVRSQAPLAPKSEGVDKKEAKGRAGQAEDKAEPAPATEAAEPAASPAPPPA